MDRNPSSSRSRRPNQGQVGASGNVPMTPLHRPIVSRSERTGENVRIFAVGDVEGFSPAGWLVNEQGKFDIAPLELFRCTDPDFLPPSSRGRDPEEGIEHASSRY